MDCKTARLLLHFDRPGTPDLAGADADDLRRHLAECPECRPAADAERRADVKIGRAVRDVPVPEDLRARLVSRLKKDRSAWYRRRVVWPVGVAAAVLLAAASGLLLLDR